MGSKTIYERSSKERRFKKKQIEIMEFRVKVIQHSKDFGIDSTRSAFNLGRRTICRWRNTLKKHNNIYDLIPKSTEPIHKRKSNIGQNIIDFIKDLKLIHPRLGKDKIARLILEIFKLVISPTKVQDIVNELKDRGILKKKVRFSLNAKTGKLHILQRKKKLF